MIRRSTALRALHDLGLATWFGGTLMGAVGVNGASRDLAVREERVGAATDAWGRFSPVGALAIGAHLVGSLGLLVVNRDRVRHQQGVAGVSAAKAAVTGVALGATGYSWYLGTKLGDAGSVSAASGTVPSGETPADVVAVQQQLRVLQWAIPATTGVAIALSALSGEQQRGDVQVSGRLRSLVSPLTDTVSDTLDEGRSRGRAATKQAAKKARKARTSALRTAGSATEKAVSAAPW